MLTTKSKRSIIFILLLPTFLLLLVLLGRVFLKNRRMQQEARTQALIVALKRQDIPTAIALLRQGADPNIYFYAVSSFGANSHCYTPLLWAVTFRDEKLVEVLLEKGADITAVNEFAETPQDIVKVRTTFFPEDVKCRNIEILLKQAGAKE